MTVIIADKMSDKALAILEKAGMKVDARPSRGEVALEDVIGEASGLIVRSNTKVTEELLAKAPNLKVIGRAGIGVDNIDLPAATRAGVIVMNTPFGNSVTTAEHAIALMFAVARNIPQASQSTHAGKWEKSSFKGAELFNKTLGVVGCGNIGAIVADRAKGLRMKVVAFDPFLSEDRAKNLGVTKVTLDELCEQADFITFHTPLLPETKYLFDEERFKKVKKGVYLINAARGGLVKETALLEALDNKTVAGAALDVYEVEPAKDHCLFNHPKVVMTPHLGASTNEAQENVAEQVAEQVIALLRDGEITNSLNFPSLSAEEADELSPYLALVKNLGSFVGQTIQAPVKKATIRLFGDAAELSSAPLKLKFIESLLQPHVTQINSVNALEIAKSRGIDVICEKHSENSSYQTLITVEVETEKQTHKIAGTLFNQQPRVVEISNMPLEVGLSDHMIYVRNNNTPGVIGRIGCFLAEHGYNIENFHLGFSDARNEALSLISVERPLAEVVSSMMAEIEGVNRVVYLNFE